MLLAINISDCEFALDTFYSRLPSSDAIHAWGYIHRGKISGFLAGSFGMWVLTTFLVVAITGVPYGGPYVAADRATVYPNF